MKGLAKEVIYSYKQYTLLLLYALLNAMEYFRIKKKNPYLGLGEDFYYFSGVIHLYPKGHIDMDTIFIEIAVGTLMCFAFCYS